jgi:hypothetical protein
MNNLFEIEGIQSKEIALNTNVASGLSDFMKWHQRFGHASTPRIREIIDRKHELSIKESCGACSKGKMIKLPFKGHFTPTLHPMEVVHGDIVGPITPATNGGCRYFLTLVDQHPPP